MDRNFGHIAVSVEGAASPPHGGVDRNASDRSGLRLLIASPPHGGVDRNRHAPEEVSKLHRSPPHGGVDRNADDVVTSAVNDGRPLTGAWIETSQMAFSSASSRRPLTGAWIETLGIILWIPSMMVAPSRGRGSKPLWD